MLPRRMLPSHHHQCCLYSTTVRRLASSPWFPTNSARWPLKGPVPLIINGRDVSTPESTFPVTSPLSYPSSSTSSNPPEPIWHSSAASPALALSAADSCAEAFPSWSVTKPQFRRDLLLRAADIVKRPDRAEELEFYLHSELGAGKEYRRFTMGLMVEHLRDTAGKIADSINGTVIPFPVAEEGMRGMVLRKPMGVVLGIAPWNAPFNLGLRAVLYPIAAGNTALLKGSELTPRCFWAIGDVLREAGLPDGVVNLVLHRPGEGEGVTNALIAHPAVRKVNFTGSAKVGALIAAEAGRNLKPTLMELGGKASAIVFGDADLRVAARGCALGAFLNAGQICMSTERILVHESIAAEFQKLLWETVNDMFGGDDEDDKTPVLVTAAAANRNRELIEDALSKGAVNLDDIYGEPSSSQQTTKNEEQELPTTRMRPVLLTNMSKSMRLYAEESFGPSASLYTFSTEGEAVDLANDTEYGLTASIYTEDLRKGLRVAEGLESGAVHINSMTVHDENALPHGGVKRSGFGRFNGGWGLGEFLGGKGVTWME